jgi:hypothetical protein
MMYCFKKFILSGKRKTLPIQFLEFCQSTIGDYNEAFSSFDEFKAVYKAR